VDTVGFQRAREETQVTDHPFDIEVTREFDASRERVYQAFTVPDLFAEWYGPVRFPAQRDSVQIDPRVSGSQRFAMVSEDDPSFRTEWDGRFTEVVENELLASSGSWSGVPGQADLWESHLRVELQERDGKTRLVIREGPHPTGTADLGRQAWEMMLAKLETLLA
jgi:uncharacterized protein YndB with AHSA1/START domain